MVKSIKYNLQLLFLLFTLTDCNPNMKTTDWLPTECAPAGFPMAIIKATLIDHEGKEVAVPEGKILNNGWGALGSTRVMNETNNSIPEKLVITWFSYAEDKFYKGDISLPVDQLQKHFTDGYISPDTRSRNMYDLIKVGVAPGGYVSVWLSGESITKEIISAQAGETDYDWSQFFDNPDMSREKYIASTLINTLGDSTYQQLVKNPPARGFWAKYQQKYNWKPQLIGLNESQEILFKTYNGESEFMYDPSADKALPRAVIKESEVRWTNLQNQKFIARTTFNEDEIFAAFKKLSPGNGNQPLLLKIEIGNTTTTLRISLANENSYYELTQCVTHVYSL